MNKLIGYAGYAAFAVAFVAMIGSLLASELFELPPCDLCWYQRVFMYPLAFIIGIGIMRRDAAWPITALVLGGIGWVIALYHTLLQWGVIPSSLAPCTNGVSCAAQEMDPLLGFITIPVMSLVAFTVINILTVMYWKGAQNDERI